MASRSLAGLFLLCALLSLAAVAHAGSTPEDFFRRGRDALEHKDWKGARELLAQSWAQRKSFDTAALLGQCELKLGKFRDAAEHLDYALRNFPNQDPAPGAKQRIDDALGSAKKHVHALTVEVNEPGAQVSLDGAPVGRAPLEAPLFLEPGEHTLGAALEGRNDAKQTVQASAGQASSVTLALAEAGASAPANGPGESAPAASSNDTSADRGAESDKSIAPVVIGAAVFAVGLASGIGFTLASNGKASDRDALVGTLPSSSSCKNPGTNAATCEQIASLEDDRTRLRNFAYVGYGVAGAAAIGTALYWFWPRKSAASTAVIPTISPRGLSLGVHGRF